MSAGDAHASIQWREALRWIDRAAEDIAVARLALAEGLAGPASFHVQQAVEKGLKALLVAAAADVPRTHDVATLAALAGERWPELASDPFPLAHVGEWYMTSRYPDLDETAPTIPEVSEALAAANTLLGSIRAAAPRTLTGDAPGAS